ncbi:hypothetical protein, partial [Granulicatella balaenopterae]
MLANLKVKHKKYKDFNLKKVSIPTFLQKLKELEHSLDEDQTIKVVIEFYKANEKKPEYSNADFVIGNGNGDKPFEVIENELKKLYPEEFDGVEEFIA